MNDPTGRRKFVRNIAASASGMLLGNAIVHGAEPAQYIQSDRAASFNLMKEVFRYRKLDAHVHVGLSQSGPEENIEFAERLGIDKMFISKPITQGPATPVEFRAANDSILQAMRRHPGKFTGMLTLNPTFQKESLEELNRCVGEGMIGVKVYHQVKINNPMFYPVIEKLIDLKMILLMHAETTLGIAGYRMKYDKKIKPNASIPEDFVDIAKRYPEAMFQFAHIGGGPDWEYACKVLKDSPNVYVDVSGSNNENNMVAFAVRCLGIDRVLFASDNSYYQSVGKIIDADLTEEQKRKIFFDNYNAILKRGGYHVD
jgi:predicted TIM-barrel fold metal-dependent hydrolase